MKDKEKAKFSIYRILGADDILGKLIEHLRSKSYQPIKCVHDHQTLLTKLSDPDPPPWQSFLQQLAQDRSEVSLVKITPSFVLLTSIENTHYAVTGGNGHFHIAQFVDQDFGLDTISRILEPDRIRCIKQTVFQGKLSQHERMFKEFYNYEFDASNWGKLTKEIIGQLNDELFKTQFKISPGRSRSIRLAAKSSFWIGKSVKPEELHSILNTLHRIQRKQKKINLFEGYNQVTQESLKEALLDELLSQLQQQYEDYLTQPENFAEANIYLSYSDAKELILCDKYLICLPSSKGSVSVETLELPTVFRALADRGKQRFTRYYLDQINIAGLNDEDIEREIHGGLKQFIRAEVNYHNQDYFFVDGKWFELSSAFQEEINELVEKIIGNCSETNFALPLWQRGAGVKTEPDYISEICRDKNMIHLHNKHIHLHNGRSKAELCDVVSLYDGIHLVFIKQGTGSVLRELFAQVRMSVELFTRDKQFKKTAIDKVYQNRRFRNGSKLNFEEFSIVLAIKDKLLNRKPKPLAKKLTTLAKLDLIHCIDYVKNDLGIESIIVYEIKSETIAKPILN